MRISASDRTDFRVMTTRSTLDDFGTRVYNAAYCCVGRMTAKFSSMRPEQKYDLVSEIMTKACVARDDYDPSLSTVETWVSTIAWRTIDDWQKKWQHREALTDSYDETSDIDGDDAYGSSCGEDWRCYRSSPELYGEWYADCGLGRRERSEEILSALGTLSESDRKLAQMLADRMDSGVMAQRLGINENALYARIFKMRKRLRDGFSKAA